MFKWKRFRKICKIIFRPTQEELNETKKRLKEMEEVSLLIHQKDLKQK